MNEQPYEAVGQQLQAVREEIQQFIVGQQEAVDFTLYAMLADGHVLLEGLPGLGKTMLIRTIADVLALSFARIQFTPDLMPADITGTSLLQADAQGKQQFVFQEGPIFHQMVLADEINRATPKTQSALLEAMGEKTVTILGETRNMAAPFFVLATQNPIEMEGTYPLPEAQMDRFLCKVVLPYPTKQELMGIMKRTTTSQEITLTKQMTAAQLVEAQRLVKDVLLADEILAYAVELVSRTHPDNDANMKPLIQYGSGPRGVQSVIKLAKARAVVEGRFHVSIHDIHAVAKPALRHRLLLTYEAEMQQMTADDCIEQLIASLRQGQHI